MEIFTGIDAMALPIANRAIVEARIAGDMVEHVCWHNVSARLADNHAKLTLVVEVVRYKRFYERLFVTTRVPGGFRK